MSREEVEQELNHVDGDPRIRRELKEIVEEISTNLSGNKTKDMMYDLVHVVLELDERIRQLEYQVCSGSMEDELKRQQLVLQSKEPYFNQSD